MQAAVKWGVILALAVTGINTVWVLAGLHTSPLSAFGYLGVVIVLDIVAVVLALKASASENSYLNQLLGGLVVGMVGGVGIFLTSFLMLSFVFPDMIPEQIAGFTAYYESLPLDDAQKQALIEPLKDVTPLNSSFQGAIGTLATSLIVGAIAAIFLRRKSAAP